MKKYVKKHQLTVPLHILSLGVGIQSTTLYYMSALGLIQRFDYAIFADPGREKKKTYIYLKKLCIWAKKHNGPPIIICGKKSLYEDLLYGTNSKGTRFASIPAFTPGSDGYRSTVKRQCTGEYKIREVNKAIRKLYGVSGHEWTPPTFIYIGISTDEASRMKIPQKKWQTLIYPLCSYSITKSGFNKIAGSPTYSRQDCINWLIKNHFPVPVSSSCTFCPYQSDQDWLNLKEHDPKEFKAMIFLDRSIRDSSLKGLNRPLFLHSSLKPLDQVAFKNRSGTLFDQCNSGFCNT